MHFVNTLNRLFLQASAAVVELLPLVSMVELQSALSIVFPSAAALFAAAASVAKARCEVCSHTEYFCSVPSVLTLSAFEI